MLMFGKHRLLRTSYGVLASSMEAEAVAARRRSLVTLHSRGARGAARGKRLHASLLAHPLCWSNRVLAPTPLARAVEPMREAPRSDPAPRPAPPRPAVPHHAQRPMYAAVGGWHTYLPWGAPGFSRTHGPYL
jgi:hypothetical protein